MKTQNIEVEGLPDGCEAVAVLFEPNYFNKYTGDDGYIYFEAKVKVKKIQPRRMIFDEIMDHSTIELTDHLINGVWCREVKEADIPLTNDDLMKGLFEGNQTSVNKVKQFIKDK